MYRLISQRRYAIEEGGPQLATSTTAESTSARAMGGRGKKAADLGFRILDWLFFHSVLWTGLTAPGPVAAALQAVPCFLVT